MTTDKLMIIIIDTIIKVINHVENVRVKHIRHNIVWKANHASCVCQGPMIQKTVQKDIYALNASNLNIGLKSVRILLKNCTNFVTNARGSILE